ncbi:MAG TPA: glycosyltransferase family 9 protein [Longimicrobium sp.]|nr:glycosyltransferase family 9 protein [Longimicrobium sp.]
MRLFAVTQALDATVEFTRERQVLRAVVSPLEDGAAASAGTVAEGWFRLRPPAPGVDPRHSTYFGGMFEWQTLMLKLAWLETGPRLRFLSRDERRALLGAPGMPPRLGWNRADPFVPIETQLAAVSPPADGRPARIAVINLFHTAFGDAILCLTVLRELRARLGARLGPVRLELFQNAYDPEVHALYAGAGEVDAIHPLPAPVARLAEFDGWVDLTEDPVPPGQHWLDGCLHTAGIDPATVPPERKRNRLPLSADSARRLDGVADAAKAAGAPVLLFHPAASTPIRSIPAHRVAPLLDAILARTGWTVACAVPTGYTHPRFVDWSPHSRSFADFAYLISRADRVLTVDTSVYHVADARDVPGVVLFTSIDPAERIRYYPYLHGISLGHAGALAGVHRSDRPADAAAIDALWDGLNLDEVIAAIEAMALKRDAALALAPG